MGKLLVLSWMRFFQQSSLFLAGGIEFFDLERVSGSIRWLFFYPEAKIVVDLHLTKCIYKKEEDSTQSRNLSQNSSS